MSEEESREVIESQNSIENTMQDCETLKTEGPSRDDDTNKQENDEDDDDDDDDDDDFGAFSDASFDNFEEPLASKELKPTSYLKTESKFPQSLFKYKEQLKAKLEELTNVAFPVQLQAHQVPENPTILNERSQHLLERLTSLLYLKPYNWQRSSLRRQLLVTLGLPDHLETTKRNRFNTFNADGYLVKPFKELNITDEEREELINESDSVLKEYLNKLDNDERLQNSTDEELDMIMKRYEGELNKVEKLLSVWEYEKTKLEEDNITFESVVENLVGHTQRLRREETLKALKKERKESKRFSLFRKKK